jgi:hypothetical protein
MGYCMSQENAEFRIAKSKHAAAIKKLKELMKRTDLMRGGSNLGGKWIPHFSWVETDEVLNATSLAEVMEAFRWTVEHDADDGNITSISFSGEKLGDDQHFFEAIAEFVDDGSFIEMRGEDGALWRWIFSGGKVTEKHATVSWD